MTRSPCHEEGFHLQRPICATLETARNKPIVARASAGVGSDWAQVSACGPRALGLITSCELADALRKLAGRCQRAIEASQQAAG
jgi:hypothetical protein